MNLNFELSVFRFDAKTDYLPYFKKYEIQIEKNLYLSDLLEKIKKIDQFFEYPQDKYACIVVNEHFVNTNVSIEHIFEYFGNELSFEPISQKRAVKDLIINKQDFLQVFNLLKNISQDKLKDKYESLIRYFYASLALQFDKMHYGTSLFLFCNDLIELYPDKSEEILQLISHENHGIWYHTPLTHKIFPYDKNVENVINKLKSKIINQKLTLSKNVQKYLALKASL